MKALFKKEIRYFFTSSIGYVVIAAFLLFNNLFLWILSGDYNIFESGFASLQPFFLLSAWIFVFLTPALTMRIISEEKRSGMLPLLFTYPISTWKIVLAKYLSVLFFIFVLLLFSGIYVYMVWQLGMPEGNMDMASTIGSYIALFLLGATFVAVGMLSSALSQSQIIAFVIATFLNFFLFFGLDEIIALFSDNLLFSVGFKVHFEDISRGVIDTRNILYFLCITLFFLYVTQLFLQAEKKWNP